MHAMGGVTSNPFATWHSKEMGGHLHAPAAVPPSTGRWLGLKVSPDGTENLTPLRFIPQPTASHYTDYTILAAIHFWMSVYVCTSERVIECHNGSNEGLLGNTRLMAHANIVH
jgi:hypothetical protein